MTVISQLKVRQLQFQLTHPWGCDRILIVLCVICKISTHTPVRVWLLLNISGWDSANFNSHTREGVTQGQWTGSIHGRFQLTHPWGCDSLNKYLSPLISISTHTPVRVWLICWTRRAYNLDFNSHTREGVTYQEFSFYPYAGFQLTHPWGCDAYLLSFALFARFQLTHPWGCDFLLHSSCYALPISTHTPVRVWLWSIYII